MNYWIWCMKKRAVLRINFMFMAYAEEWIVESLTGNVPDFEGRLQVYFWKH